MARVLGSLLLLVGGVDAFWRVSCANMLIARIDPIVNPGTLSAHAHTIVGASNIGVNSTFQSLLNSECSSCEVTPDKSAYWTPNMYYQRPNGSFEYVPHSGAVIYYLGRGMTQDGKQNIQPFPKGFQMVSGTAAARRYNSTGMTWGNATFTARSKSDAISFACLHDVAEKETPNLVDPRRCTNGLRVQVHFQSCWDGKNVWKPDNSHVAYLSGIDNGVCPPNYPILLPHIFLETIYIIDAIANRYDGGRYLFSMGDPTGYGMHGDFLNGWDSAVQKIAVKDCLAEGGPGLISDCPILQANSMSEFTKNCPERPTVVMEQVKGMLDKLPGCIKITEGPESASPADMNCAANVSKPSIIKTVDSTPRPTANPAIGQQYGLKYHKYLGCGDDPSSATIRTLNAITTSATNMTVETCQTYCTSKGYRLSGLEVGTQCFCDNYLNPSATFYAGINMIKGCNIFCPGNRVQLCGGANFINVYNNTDPTFIPTNDTTNSAYQLTVPLLPFSKEYLGCASEGSPGRALNITSLTSTKMTVALCRSYCADYAFYGLEFATQCFCGNALASGAAVVDQGVTAKTSNCSQRCVGEYGQLCGAAGYLSLYSNSDYRPVVIAPKAGSYAAQGCVREAQGKALTGAFMGSDTLTPESCAAFCKGKKMKYMGLEYGRECYCGNTINTSGGQVVGDCPTDTSRLIVCKGNKYTYCGAGGLLSLYVSPNY